MKNIKTIFTLTLFALSANAIALEPSNIIVFGDSLSDVGYQNNLPADASLVKIPWPKGKEPTYTSNQYGTGDMQETGKVWSEDIAKYYDDKYKTTRFIGLTKTNNVDKPINVINMLQNIAVSGDSNGENYAAGGATTKGTGIQIKVPISGKEVVLYSPPSLKDQVCQYLDGKKDKDTNAFIWDAQGNCQPQKKADPNAEYIIWAGANDLLKFASNLNKSGQMLAPNGTVIQNDEQFKYYGAAIVKSAIINISNEIKLLKSQGAEHIIFIDLPDVSLTPLVPELLKTNPKLPQLKEDFYVAVYSFAALANSYISAAGEGIDLKMLRTDLLLDRIVSDKKISVYGENFTFNNVSDSACTPNKDMWSKTAITCDPTLNADGSTKKQLPVGYVFEDTVHPTSRVHAAIAKGVEECIDTGTCPA